MKYKYLTKINFDTNGTPYYRTVCDGISKWIPFRSVKGALSSGASPAIVLPTGKELYARFIWWSIIGGVRYKNKQNNN